MFTISFIIISFCIGLIIDGIRYAFETILRADKLRPDDLYTKVKTENFEIFKYIHTWAYPFYQFYSNTTVALIFLLLSMPWYLSAIFDNGGSSGIFWISILVILFCIIFNFIAARRSLRKYYLAVEGFMN